IYQIACFAKQLTRAPFLTCYRSLNMIDDMISRRSFVRGALAGGAAFGLGVRPTWGADTVGNPPAGKIGDFKISLAEWSIHKALFSKDVAEREFGREITNLDFPQIAREHFGIEAVEFVNQFFKGAAGRSQSVRSNGDLSKDKAK